MRKIGTMARRIAPALVLALAARGAVAQEKARGPGAGPARGAGPDLGRLAPGAPLVPGLRPPRRPRHPLAGLDLAAEYIAAQFRRAGLEPVGDDGYFQTANWEVAEPDRVELPVRDRRRRRGRSASTRTGSAMTQPAGFDVAASALVQGRLQDLRPTLEPEDLAGKAVLVELPDPRKSRGPSGRRPVWRSGSSGPGWRRARPPSWSSSAATPTRRPAWAPAGWSTPGPPRRRTAPAPSAACR